MIKFFKQHAQYHRMRMFSFFFFILSFNGFSQSIPVASFPFNGNANDASGNGNNGVLGGENANPILTTDRFGNANSAYEFGGYYNRNWITVPNSSSLQFGSQMSISLWFKQCSFGGMNGWGSYSPNGYFILVSKAGDGISVNPGIWCGTYTDGNNLLHVNFNNTNYQGYNQPLNFTGDASMSCFDNCEWVHLVVVINNDIWQMYLNGNLKKQITINNADFTNANTRDLHFGRMFGGGMSWYPFYGVIDDVNIYNTALTQADVTTLFGNYDDPLLQNNTISIDSIKIINSDCYNPNSGSISVYPNGNNAPYQYSIDGGSIYQASNVFTNLSTGDYTISIKTNCNKIDTVLNIGTASIKIHKNVSICQGENYLGHNTNVIIIDTLLAANGCDSIVTTVLNVNPQTTPVFNSVLAICSGNTLSPLPTTSNNGINGTWFPALNNTTTTTYTFTPSAGQCATSKTLTISVNPNITPTFNSVTAICSGNALSPLPATSNNGITGTWFPALNNTTTKTYTFTPTTGQCATTTTLTITVNPNITPTFNSVTAICSGNALSPLPATSNNGITGTWVPALNNLTTTTYTFSQTAGQCISATSLTIIVNPNPVVTIDTAQSICLGQSVTLAATGGGSYQWCTTQTNATITVTPDSTKNYTVTVTDSIGCKTSAEVLIIVTPHPAIIVAPDSASICEGNSVILTASGASTYNWAPAIGLSNITGAIITATPTTNTTYTVTGTTNGCTDATTVIINVDSKFIVNIGQNRAICSDSAIILNAGNPEATCFWSTGDTSQNISVSLPGTYWVKVTNGACIVSDSISISSLPDFNLGEDISLCNKVEIKLSTDIVASSYLWSTGQTTPAIMVQEPGEYWLSLEINNCNITDTIIIKGELNNFYIANSFTPNMDGLNDIFTPKGQGITAFDMTIFDRWGEMIFKTEDINTGWDGTIKQKSPQVGIYIWIINYRSTCTGQRVMRKSGHVIIPD